MARRSLSLVLLATLLLSGLGFAGCGSSSPTPCSNDADLGCVAGDAAFVLIDLIRNQDDIFAVASDTVLLAQDAVKLVSTIGATQTPPAPSKRGHVVVSILYDKQGVYAQDVYDIDSGKASLGILFEGGKTFESISSNRVDIDATQTQRITIVPLQKSTRTVTVSAQKGWQNTGIFLEEGKEFSITYISGVWTISKGNVGTSDAAGQPLNPPPNLICNCGEPVPGYSTQALIGQIGQGVDHSPLQVGDDFSAVAYANDFLYFRMNLPDQLLPESSGSVKVSIETDNG